MLAEARNRVGLSQAEIAAQMNLLVATVQALENDDFAALPEPPSVHSYLRMYAKILGLAPGQLIRMYDRQYRLESGYYSGPSRRSRRGSLVLWRIAIPLAVLAVLFAIWQGYMKRDPAQVAEFDDRLEEPDTPAGIPPILEIPDAAPDNAEQGLVHTEEDLLGDISNTLESGSPSGETLSDEGVQAVENESRDEDLAEDISGTPETEGSSIDTPLAGSEQPGMDEPVAEASSGDTPLAESEQPGADEPVAVDLFGGEPGLDEPGTVDASMDSMTLTYLELCWVEVRDADSKLLAMDLFRPGTVTEVRGKTPFRVLLGNAPGVIIEVNGKQFDHTRFSRSDGVAQFRVSGNRFN